MLKMSKIVSILFALTGNEKEMIFLNILYFYFTILM
jgi:hypothetical protein